MKIDPINSKKIKDINIGKKSGPGSEANFQEHLDKAIEAQNTDTANDTVKPLEISNAGAIKTFNKPEVQKLEKVFSTLELYRNALNNPEIKSAQMNDLIIEMNEEKDELMTYMSGLQHDDRLRAIVKETALLILNETNKYYRSFI